MDKEVVVHSRVSKVVTDRCHQRRQDLARAQLRNLDESVPQQDAQCRADISPMDAIMVRDFVISIFNGVQEVDELELIDLEPIDKIVLGQHGGSDKYDRLVSALRREL